MTAALGASGHHRARRRPSVSGLPGIGRLRELEDDENALMSQLAAAYYAVDVDATRALTAEAIERYPESVEARVWAGKMARIADVYDLLLDVGRALCRQTRCADSIDLFAAALEMRDEPEAYLLLGRRSWHWVRWRAHPAARGRGCCDPEDDSICVDVAAAYIAGGRLDIAKAWLHQGARVHPRSAQVWQAIAGLALDEGERRARSTRPRPRRTSRRRMSRGRSLQVRASPRVTSLVLGRDRPLSRARARRLRRTRSLADARAGLGRLRPCSALPGGGAAA